MTMWDFMAGVGIVETAILGIALGVALGVVAFGVLAR